MKILSSGRYQKLMLQMLRYSNTIAVIMILVAFYVCFSKNAWLYAIILGLSSAYLGWLTCQHLICESSCTGINKDLDVKYQIEIFSNRLSIVSSATITFIGLAFSALIFRYLLYPVEMTIDNPMKSIDFILHTTMIVGLFKALLIYMISDKIHTAQILLSFLFRENRVIRFLNISTDEKNPGSIYPMIFINGKPISSDRYTVNTCDHNITVAFTPPLSIDGNSKIEYDLIPDNDDSTTGVVDHTTEHDWKMPLFKCTVSQRDIVSGSNDPKC